MLPATQHQPHDCDEHDDSRRPPGDERCLVRRPSTAQLRWLQWVTPAATGALLVLDACLGEQQRGTAGLLDRPLRSL